DGDPDNGFPYRLWLEFDAMAREIRRLGKGREFKTLDTRFALLRDRQNGFAMLQLMLAIPSKMMASMMRQTIEYDYFGKPYPSIPDTPGIYIVTVLIVERKGKFLSRLELQKLIQTVKVYDRFGPSLNEIVRARRGTPLDLRNVSQDLIGEYCADLFDNSDDDDGLSEEQFDEVQAAFDLILRIDKRASVRYDTNTRGCLHVPPDDEEHGRERLELLTAMLERRLGGAKWDDDLDPEDEDNTVLQVQSPQYVGSANNLRIRTAAYSLSRDMSGLNKPLVMMLGALEELPLVQPALRTRVVVRTWTNEQLVPAEMLVITLARSLVWQDGFNREQGGGNVGKSLTWAGRSSCKAFVMALTDDYGEHLEAELEAVKRRLQYVEDADAMVEATERLHLDVKAEQRKLKESVQSAQMLQPEGVINLLQQVQELQAQQLVEATETLEALQTVMEMLEMFDAQGRAPDDGDDAQKRVELDAAADDGVGDESSEPFSGEVVPDSFPAVPDSVGDQSLPDSDDIPLLPRRRSSHAGGLQGTRDCIAVRLTSPPATQTPVDGSLGSDPPASDPSMPVDAAGEDDVEADRLSD
ncbi:hypothetical protein ACHAQA_008705, partial [Verticillium albo-atrum]